VLRKQGLRAAVICSDAFVSLAELQAEALDTSGLLELFVLPHPLAGISHDELTERKALAETLIMGWVAALEQDGSWKPT
jgi:hypothetical protein